MDQPTDKLIVKLDDDKLKELFNRLQPGDAVSIASAKLVLDQVDGDVAVCSIEEIDFSPTPEPAADAEAPEVGPELGEEGEAAPESAALTMMSERE